MIAIRLLTISHEEVTGFDDFFDQVKDIDVARVSPQVVDGEARLRIEDEPIGNFDAVFTDIPAKNAVFGRVLLETIEEKDIPVDNYSTAYFTAAKKNYLYYVLTKRGIESPTTISVAAEKAVRNIDKHLEFPIIGKKLEDLEETEKRKIDSKEEIKSFSDGIEYEEDVLLFQELNEGEKYRCLFIEGEVISLKEGSDGWEFTGKNLKYCNLDNSQKELVREACESVGLRITEVLIRGSEIYDINPNPDLELYSEKAGKNAFSAVAKTLKED
ncbi:MAG: hypothetical protein BRC29_05120 [Nanohaloarchaea archaeon SW_7_43_1]|nr:MAG: hypothetical protein BRC29_05120 [Nanohaloarchaea archaeon SW_7_43_1]